jgi:hypothetical protein
VDFSFTCLIHERKLSINVTVSDEDQPNPLRRTTGLTMKCEQGLAKLRNESGGQTQARVTALLGLPTARGMGQGPLEPIAIERLWSRRQIDRANAEILSLVMPPWGNEKRYYFVKTGHDGEVFKGKPLFAALNTNLALRRWQ